MIDTNQTTSDKHNGVNEEIEGRTARTADSLTGMLGWNSVGVFEAGEYRDGDRLKINKATIYVILSDPYPEYKTIVFINGKHHHTGDLLCVEYRGTLEDYLHDYGKATVMSLDDTDFIERTDNGIPRYVPTTEQGGDNVN